MFFHCWKAKVAIILFTVFFPGITQALYTIDNAPGNIRTTVNAGTGLTEGNIVNFIGTLFRGALGVMSLVFFGLMVYGGFVWLTSRGNEEKVTKAKDTVIAAVIGISITVAAYAITVFVSGRLTQ